MFQLGVGVFEAGRDQRVSRGELLSLISQQPDLILQFGDALPVLGESRFDECLAADVILASISGGI